MHPLITREILDDEHERTMKRIAAVDAWQDILKKGPGVLTDEDSDPDLVDDRK
jgi:hypothetical protein